MHNCSDVAAITALACVLSQHLSDDELAVLAADLVMLSDTLSAIAVRKSLSGESESTADAS